MAMERKKRLGDGLFSEPQKIGGGETLKEKAARLEDRLKTADERYKSIDITSVDIEFLRNAKIEQLKEACSNAIYEGFTATNEHHYGFNEHDQANFTQQTLLLMKGWEGSVAWKTIDAGVVEHTVEEFQQVINDAAAHKFSQQNKYWDLEQQVLNANTNGEVDAIAW